MTYDPDQGQLPQLVDGSGTTSIRSMPGASSATRVASTRRPFSSAATPRGSLRNNPSRHSRRAAVRSTHRHRNPRRSAFYPAEDYHQDYYLKNPLKYKFYRTTCGRDSRLQDVGERRRPIKPLQAKVPVRRCKSVGSSTGSGALIHRLSLSRRRRRAKGPNRLRGFPKDPERIS